MTREDPREVTHFGHRQGPLADKQALVDDVFHSVASRYDLMNDLMSGGLHRAWKDVLANTANPPKGSRPFKLLDVAGGTGDIAFRVAQAGGTGTRATVLDINAHMLAVGRARALDQGYDDVVTFVDGNAEALPLPERSFDAVTIAFGIRNVPRIDEAGLDALYDFYSFNVIPTLGRMVTGDREAYCYLVESIRRFPHPEAFAQMMRDAGFARVGFERMAGGIVALHSG